MRLSTTRLHSLKRKLWMSCERTQNKVVLEVAVKGNSNMVSQITVKRAYVWLWKASAWRLTRHLIRSKELSDSRAPIRHHLRIWARMLTIRLSFRILRFLRQIANHQPWSPKTQARCELQDQIRDHLWRKMWGLQVIPQDSLLEIVLLKVGLKLATPLYARIQDLVLPARQP